MAEFTDRPDHPTAEQVILSFRFYRDIIIPYEARPVYDPAIFEFSPRPHRTPDNIRGILSAFANVDQVRRVQLTALEPIRVNRYTRWLDMSFTVHLDATVMFYESGPQLVWNWRRSIPKPAMDDVKPILLASKPIICGTISLFLKNWKLQEKEHIRNSTRRRARIMRGNAEAILAFLGEPF